MLGRQRGLMSDVSCAGRLLDRKAMRHGFSWFKRRSAIAIASLSLVILSSDLAAQSNVDLAGVVYDQDDGHSIASATVILLYTGFHTTTDESGYFQFEHLPEDRYQVQVSANDYDSTVLYDVKTSIDVTAKLRIFLSRKPHTIPGFTVKGKASEGSTDNVTVIGREEIEQNEPADLVDLLSTIPGVHVQQSGSNTARVSIRGSASRHVLVLVDGQQVNSSADGEANLSSIPVESIQRLEVHRGGNSAEFGPSALGGIINVITTPKAGESRRHSQMSYEEGKWSTISRTISTSDFLPVCSLYTTFDFQSRYSDGDFYFEYTQEPVNDSIVKDTRTNNVSHSTNYRFAATYLPQRETTLKLSLQSYVSERGLPDVAWRQNTYAHATDDRLLLNGTWSQRFSDRIQTDVKLDFSRFSQLFVDTQSVDTFLFGNVFETHTDWFNTLFDNDIYSLKSSAQWFAFNGHTLSLGTQILREKLNNESFDTSMGYTTRNSTSLFFSDRQEILLPQLTGSGRLTLEAALRWDHVSVSHDTTSQHEGVLYSSDSYVSPRIGASVVLGNRFSLMVRGDYGKSLCLPTLNALFWQGDARSKGNPLLKPERSEHSECGVEFTANLDWFSVTAGATYYHTHNTDLVQWQPDHKGVWKPFNLDAARITGHEDVVSISLWDRLIVLSYDNNITNSRNLVRNHNTYGTRLTITPYYQMGIRARLNQRWAFASYSVRMVDLRYALESNAKQLHAYRLDDLRIGGRTYWKSWRLQVDYEANNLRNEDYALMSNYPMPRREWQVGIKILHGIDAIRN